MSRVGRRKMIIAEPHGGLSNRMRVIASVMWLSDLAGVKPKIIWSKNDALNCPLDELFYIENRVDIIEKTFFIKMLAKKEYESLHKRIVYKFFNGMMTKKFSVYRDAEIHKIKHGELDFCIGERPDQRIYINTCEEFGENTGQFSSFVPVPFIQQEIDRQCECFSKSTVGIHIRRTDNVQSIERSPTRLFIQRINEDIQKDPAVNYFLATDDPETELRLIELFGKRIIARKKQYARNTKQGIKDALIDLFCLANTSRIYGSYWSSFSTVASRINKIPIEKLQLD